MKVVKSDFLLGYKSAKDTIIKDLRDLLDKEPDNETFKDKIREIVEKYEKTVSKLDTDLNKVEAYKTKGKPDFNVKLGMSYLINEKKPKIIYNIFTQVVSRKFAGLCISRIDPASLEIYQKVPQVKYYWLTKMDVGIKEKEYSGLPPSDLSRISATVQDFLKKNDHGIVLLEGIESMINNNDFNSVIKMLETLRDYIASRKGILLLSLDLDVLELRQKSILVREFESELIKKSDNSD